MGVVLWQSVTQVLKSKLTSTSFCNQVENSYGKFSMKLNGWQAVVMIAALGYVLGWLTRICLKGL